MWQFETYAPDPLWHFPKVRVLPLLVVRMGSHESAPARVAKTPDRYGRPRGEILMSQELKVTKQVRVSVQFQDRNGNPAKVDGPPKWFVDNTELMAIANDTPDGMSVICRPVGPLGICTVSVRADADLGEGVREIAGFVEFEIVGGDAEAVKLAVGPEEDQVH